MVPEFLPFENLESLVKQYYIMYYDDGVFEVLDFRQEYFKNFS